jgi:D-arginine dehydrogenase
MQFDVAIIGGGIAGLSCAAYLGQHASVVVLEAEPTLGYHATGRSAALYTQRYGSGVIRSLAKASKPYLLGGETPLVTPRGLVFTAAVGDEPSLDELVSGYGDTGDDFRRLSSIEVEAVCPLFPSHMTAGGLYEPGAGDIDVAGLQARFIETARNHDVVIRTGARVDIIERTASGWSIVAGDVQVRATRIVNAAGAWGDVIATLAGVAPLDLRALTRSVFLFDPGSDPSAWPMFVDAREQWYIKPEGPLMLGSAASELPSEPVDAKPEELDIARGIDRVNERSTLSITHVKTTWAGLRTFTGDRVPAVGFDPDAPDFFWLVGQGGYGIKTSPALGLLASSLLCGAGVPDELAALGVSEDALSPRRFR